MNKDNKPQKKILITLTVIMSVLLTAAVSAAGAGTSDDPLVTLSYINGEYRNQLLISLMDSIDDKYFAALREDLSAKMYDEVLENVKAGIANGSITVNMPETTAVGTEVTTAPETAEQPSAADFAYEVVRMEAGQALGALGACEVILRSGSAVAFVDSEANRAAGVGLSDCTDGGEILDSEAIPQRHLLIIPRADGRGMIVTSGEAYLMVRGEYEIVGVNQ